MKTIQDLLLSFPFKHVHPVTPVGTDIIGFEEISSKPFESESSASILVYLPYINEARERLTEDDVLQIMQLPQVVGILLFHPRELPIKEQLSGIYALFEVPVIHLSYPLKEMTANNKALSTYQLIQDTHNTTMKELFGRSLAVQKAIAQPVTVVDQNFKTVSEKVESEATSDWVQFLIHSRSKWLQQFYFRPERFVDEAMNQSIPLTCYPVYAHEEIRYYVITPVTEVTWFHDLLAYFAMLLSLVSQQEEKMNELHLTFKNHFLHDLLYNNFKSEQALLDQAATWGWDLSDPHHLAVIRVSTDDSQRHQLDEGWRKELFERLLKRFRQDHSAGLIEVFQDDIVFILRSDCSIEEAYPSDRLRAYLQEMITRYSGKMPQVTMKAGIGKCYPNTKELNKSYQEALMALKLGNEWSREKQVFHIEDLGVLRLLFYLNQDHLVEFSSSYLKPLIDTDRQHQTDYLETLKQWIIHDTNVQETAGAMHFHPNTLRKRLQKINKLLGVDIYNHEDFVNISIAVKIHAIDFFQTNVKDLS
ncbi:PucR family transcriptional regulator [Salisediminibacterium beveridgei]|uniref:Regulator of polyketide synthase expression n=1 Tax=Salisediminibacterium beveridgei TaxID=632773 RepID=A0A1D7QRV9_9BACI|nr:helix-turn-helix domain-containing protein [Salisediminibacterium beveridgei]AOM81729.1 Regulator of polyketide synthase expression [Salisediminibacterium beveridgei]